ncbi:hypothetical protein ACFOHT_12695 [Massilia oculi]
MAQAVRWMTAAADGDEFLGTSRLGVMYFKGDGVPRDHDRSTGRQILAWPDPRGRAGPRKR